METETAPAEPSQDFKDWVDGQSYESLLSKWRFAPIGDPTFSGAKGDYYSKVMFAKKAALEHSEQVQASKNVGWGD